MGNDLHVKIKNFQSLRDVDINIPSGLTIITGKTNSGKSAIFRAIDSSLFNTCDDSMVRAGKESCDVYIDNGTDHFNFSRNKKSKSEKTAYKINDGNTLKKVGRGQLAEIGDLFNIKETKLNNNIKIKVNFWYQNDKPFLMDKTQGQLFEYLSLSSCDKYTKVLKLMSKDIKDMESDIKDINTAINTIKQINEQKERIISKNENFDELYDTVIKIDKVNNNIEMAVEKINRCEEIKSSVNKSSDALKETNTKLQDAVFSDEFNAEYNSIIQTSNYLNSVNKLISDLIEHENNIKETKETKCAVETKLSESEQVLESLRDSISDIEKENNYINKISTVLENMKIKYQEIEQKMKDINISLENPIDSVDTDSIKSTINNIESEYKETMTMESKLTRLMSLKDDIEKHELNMSDLKQELDEIEKEYNKFDVCPFCGSKLN